MTKGYREGKGIDLLINLFEAKLGLHGPFLHLTFKEGCRRGE